MQLKLQKRKKWIAVSLCTVLLFGGAAGFLLRPKDKAAEDIIWREYTAQMGDITASLDGSGKLKFTEVPHSFDADLKIESIFVEEGQEVKKGDKLVQYSKAEIEKKMTELTTSLESAKRTLQDAKNSLSSTQLQTDLSKAQSQQAAQNAYESAKRELEAAIGDLEQQAKQIQNRIDSLQQEASAANNEAQESQAADLNVQISQAQSELEAVNKQLNTQQTALQNLSADYEREQAQNQKNQEMQSQIDSLNEVGQKNAVHNAENEVNRLKSELEEAQELLNIPVLTAQADGVVLQIRYTIGEEVPSGQSIVTIGASSQKQVTVQVSQEDIGSVKEGQQVEMHFLMNPEEAAGGKVVKKSLLPTDGGDGVAYEVTIAFDEDYPNLTEGMTCSVKFILKQVNNVLILQNKAIVVQDGKQYVTVKLPDGSHEEREIKTGFSDGRISEITDGLVSGDTVVVAG